MLKKKSKQNAIKKNITHHKSPKICVISPLYHPTLGGVGRQALALTEKLGSLGVRLFVITRNINYLPKYNFNPYIPIYKAWAFKPQKHDLEDMNLINIIISLTFCLSTAIILFKKRKEYDIVHFHGASLPLMSNILQLKLYRKKVISKVAAANLGTEAGSLKGKYSILGKILISVLKKVDCFIAISEEIKEGLLIDGYDQNKIVRISNFIDTKVFYPVNKKLKKNLKKKLFLPDKKIITFSGRLVERKGIHILLRSFAMVIKKHEDIPLIILGGGYLEKDLKDQSHAYGIKKNIKFCGFVTNIHEYLNATDIYVFPSLQEGFPNALLEAMACGLPVIATKIGGVVDIIKDGENGLLVEPGNKNELAIALKKLISEPEYALSLGQNALKTIRENYDIDIIANKYIPLYAKMMNS